MKAKKLLLLLLLSTSMTGFCATITITATNSGMTFSQSSITINSGDIVHFTLGSIHDALEVSQTVWNTNDPNQIAALPGGFHVPFGGSQDVPNLSVGTHYYICEAHFSMGMKGIITVTALGVNDFQLAKNYSAFPNPTTGNINIKSTENICDLPYTVIDQAGRAVSVGKLQDETTSINLDHLPSGIYFLQINEDRRQTLKLIKR